MFSKNATNVFLTCLYIQKMTLNLIKTNDTSAYDTKDTNNTQIHFQYYTFRKSIFPGEKFLEHPYIFTGIDGNPQKR